MKKILKKYFNKLANPLLFYVDKQGFSVFKNFCLIKNDGNIYEKTLQIKDAGVALEYRLELNKKLKSYTIIISIFIYLLFIHTNFNIKGLLIYEIVWILLYFTGRIICSLKYEMKLKQLYGEYIIGDFTLPIPPKKDEVYTKNFISRIVILFFILFLLICPAFIMQKLIKINVNKNNPNYNNAEIISNIYTKFYPQTSLIYEVLACADYIAGDFNNASSKYIKALKMQEKRFTSKDYIRFANLLYLIKKSNGSQNAIDIFNELITNKKLTIEEQTKLLWIKSMFSINNNITEFIINDYNDLISSLNPKDKRNEFYIQSDKAYMLYLAGNPKESIKIYSSLIEFASQNKKEFGSNIPRLYAERGFAKRSMNDKLGANEDFLKSKINLYEIESYKPKLIKQGFVMQRF